MLNLQTSHAYEIKTLELEISYFKRESSVCTANSMHHLAELMNSYEVKAQEELALLLKRIQEESQETEEVGEATIKQTTEVNPSISPITTISLNDSHNPIEIPVLPLMNQKQFQESCIYHSSIFSQTEESKF